nr:hypothetical protein [Tanacetum cinerariifolium]
MSADFAVTFSSVYSKAQSWSIPSEDPYEEAAKKLFEQVPHPPEYVPRDYVPVFVPEFEHPKDLVLAEVGESSAAAARRQGPAMAHRVDWSYMETRLQDTERRMMVEVCTRESSEFCTRHHDAQKDRTTVRAEIEVLRNERLAYEQEGIQTREALTRSKAHCRALKARVAVLETHA